MKSHRLALFLNFKISAFFLIFSSFSFAFSPINAIIDIKIGDAKGKKHISFDLKGTNSFRSYSSGILPPEKLGGHYSFYINIQNSHTRLKGGGLFLRQFESPIVKQISITQHTQKPPVVRVIFKIPQYMYPQIKARDNHLKIVFLNNISTEKSAVPSRSRRNVIASASFPSRLPRDPGINSAKQSRSNLGDSQRVALIKSNVGIKSFLSKVLPFGNSMIVIIPLILFILVVSTIYIKFLSKLVLSRRSRTERRIRQGNKNNATDHPAPQSTTLKASETYDFVEQLKENSKKAVHQVDDTTESKTKTAPESRALRREEYEDDDISTLAETLAGLAEEYEETYQKLRQIIANKYKQLFEASQYINEQTEKLNKLVADNESMFASQTLADGLRFIDEIQTPKHPPKYAQVHKLAEEGIDRTEIAKRTELPVGEVDLLLSLSNHKESE